MGVKDNYIYEECMKELRATYGEGKENERKSKMNKQTRRISEFFAALWITLKDDMKKEAQTYREEREQQKRIKNSGK